MSVVPSSLPPSLVSHSLVTDSHFFPFYTKVAISLPFREQGSFRYFLSDLVMSSLANRRLGQEIAMFLAVFKMAISKSIWSKGSASRQSGELRVP